MRGHARSRGPVSRRSGFSNAGLPPPRLDSRPLTSPAVSPAKWSLRHEAPPPPRSLCALPGGGREAQRPARPASADPENAGQRGPGQSPLRRGPPNPAPVRQQLHTAPQTLRTPGPGRGRKQPHAAAPKRDSQVDTAALPPES